jgi:acyl-CoA thioester hydrolase
MTWTRLEWLITHTTPYFSTAPGGHFWANRGYSRHSPDAQQVIREMTISYHTPITELGEVSVELWVERVGRTSADFRFAIRSADNAVLHAEGRRVSVRLDPKTHRPAPWSDEVRRVMTALIRRAGQGPGPGQDVVEAASTAR